MLRHRGSKTDAVGLAEGVRPEYGARWVGQRFYEAIPPHFGICLMKVTGPVGLNSIDRKGANDLPAILQYLSAEKRQELRLASRKSGRKHVARIL